MFDSHSLRILEALQEDARMTVQQISERVGLSPTPCWKRIKEMEASGVIRGYTVELDRKALGLDLMVMAEVNLDRHGEKTVAQFEAAVAATRQIVRCFKTTGQADYVLMIVVRDVEQYESVLSQTLLRLPGVSQVRSGIVLKELKASAPLPL